MMNSIAILYPNRYRSQPSSLLELLKSIWISNELDDQFFTASVRVFLKCRKDSNA